MKKPAFSVSFAFKPNREHTLAQLVEFRPAIAFFNPQYPREYNRTLQSSFDRHPALENPAQSEILKSGFRIGINSLLLAIGYIIIGWTGLRGLTGGGSLPLYRQVRAR